MSIFLQQSKSTLLLSYMFMTILGHIYLSVKKSSV